MSEIKTGDRVRSYDFEGVLDCYVTGTVTGTMNDYGCERYVIEAESRTVQGVTEPCDRTFHPPVNGTPSLLGGTTQFVVLATNAEEDERMEQVLGDLLADALYENGIPTY